MRLTRNSTPETRNFFSAFFHPLFLCWLRKTQPQTRGEISLPELTKEVKVRWGPYCVPHLYASTQRDLFMAQGYLHAQERLWQMDMKRRFLCGRTAEVIGNRPIPCEGISVHIRDKGAVNLDYFFRLAGMRRAAEASLGRLPARLVEFLEAYSAGVNRYIETHLKSLPLEFRLLGYEPDPWRPEDSLTIAKGFAFFLSTSLFTRVTWTAIAEKLAGHPDKLHSLMPSYPAAGPSITRQIAADSRALLQFMSGTFEAAGWIAAGQGSNNWVVAPWRSATGGPLLCNDPHLRMEQPSFWYLIHLRAERDGKDEEEFDVRGASIPGSPCVHVGHNRQIAWGVTAALCDDADLYREKLHPAEPDTYLADGDWIRMRSEEEKIPVHGGKTVTKKIRFTRHGPLLSDFTRREDTDGAEEALAFKWTAHDPSRELCVLHGINRARDWKEFRESLSHQTAPTLNYVYADRSGNIGYSLAGSIPIRSARPSFLPLPGWGSESEWKGYIPFEELPCLYNPPEGAIATANNDIAAGGYAYHLSDLFDPPYRIRRIKELLAAKKKFSVADMAEIQQDGISTHGREITAILSPDLAALAEGNDALGKAAEKLLRWNGDCSPNSVEAALFQIFYHRLTGRLLQPALGENLYLAYLEIFNQSLFPVEQILRDSASPWFAQQPRPELVETSLRETCNELRGRLGDNMDQWTWGKIHTLTLSHPLDGNRLLRGFLSAGPFPASGDGVTINIGFYRRSKPYRQVVGPSLRMIIDLAALERSLFITSSGQSGHFLSPHYRDQTALWREGKYIRLSDDADVTDAPALILTPAD
ncbi:MAG TPA: penicillin acylase family protein [Candidatus Binatia bacterium]|jgi:penicillin amidase